jgi:transcriptional regulator with XRE-family HTH domain
MPDLRDLLHTKGRSMRSVLGLSRAVTVSRIARGAVRARASSCQAIANALGVPVETVVAACDESWNRAHPAASVGPMSDGQLATAET